MTGTDYFNLLPDDSTKIEGKIFGKKDFNGDQIVVYDFQDPVEPFYFGESAVEAIHEIVSLLPFQDEMQDWDRKWDYNEWMSTVDQFLGKPQTIITDYHFDVTQKSILNDLRKAEDDFKQTMIENSPSEIFNQASQILYVSDALFELTGFIEDFSSGDYPEHTYSYEKQISALFDRYYTNPPHNGTELFIAAAERAWYDSSVNYEVGSDDKAYFMEDYVSDYFGLLPYLKAYEPKPVELTNDAPQHSQSKSHSI